MLCAAGYSDLFFEQSWSKHQETFATSMQDLNFSKEREKNKKTEYCILAFFP